MSRNYANIFTSIWRDAEFIALSSSAQRTYLMLTSQPDITAAGTLPLTIGRWAGKASDTTPESIRADLAELSKWQFVVYDEASEELLVRSFVRWDGGYNNPKRTPVISRAALDVESVTVRRALARELGRLGLTVDGLSDRHPDSPSDGPSRGRRGDELPTGGDRPESKPSPAMWETDQTGVDQKRSEFPQANRLSNSQSARHTDGISPSDGLVETQGPYLLPTNHNPSSRASAVAHRRARRAIAASGIGADDDEATKIIRSVEIQRRPNDIGDYIRALDRDALADLLDKVRAEGVQPAYAGPLCDLVPDPDAEGYCRRCNLPNDHPRHHQAGAA